ncbi:MaoC family dehydratase [Porticoccus sp.]|uniref:MaoC family dehydratase n=1 Tax=Porticoccus sp. TaxID=2024853 RepID=UPI003F6A1E5F
MTQSISGQSDWFEITQAQINQFADATHDHQYLHVDQQRAAEGPFGKTIAHGFLYLSMVPYLMLDDLLAIIGDATVINYGVNGLRFISPVPVGSHIRLNWRVLSDEPRGKGRLLTVEVGVEIQHDPKPAMVAEWLLYIL